MLGGNCLTDFENIFLDLLLPNSRPIHIGILYRPPDQSGFLDIVSSAIADMEDFDNQEVYIVGDLTLIYARQVHKRNSIFDKEIVSILLYP